MKHLTIGILACSACLMGCVSCSGIKGYTPDYNYTILEQVILNESGHAVTLVCSGGMLDTGTEKISIEDGGEYRAYNHLMSGYYGVVLFEVDSVRMVFDGEREIVFESPSSESVKQEYNITDIDSYSVERVQSTFHDDIIDEDIDNSFNRYTYIITEDLYDMASPVK